MKLAAVVWLVLVTAAAAYLGVRLYQGVELQTDLLALLPQEDRDLGVQRAKQHVTESIGQRILLLVGDADRATARAAGVEIADTLQNSGMVSSVTFRIADDSLRRLGTSFFPYRSGLLASEDRGRLMEGKGKEIVDRAMAAVYGPVPMVDARLMRSDPFLLFPAWIASLPSPLPRMAPDDGALTVQDDGKTYVLISAQLAGNVYALAFQKRFMMLFSDVEQRLRDQHPELSLSRIGAVFYAHEGGDTATRETSTIGVVSLVGTIILVLVVFRALRPLWLCILAIAVGVLCAFAVSFWLFGTLHVAALLFGVSLIGIATDYCLQYVSARFSIDAKTPQERLRRVLPGISLGIATTLVGYITLTFAPFPGLRQVAVFSAVGLVGSFVTVLLWLPALDRAEPLRHGARMLDAAAWLWRFWEVPRYRIARAAVLAVCAILAVWGATQFGTDDDVHHLQALSPALKAQEAEIRRLTGMGIGTEFLLVRAPDEETVLQREELLGAHLSAAQRGGALAGFQAIAQVIPSAARQRENRVLVQDKLITPFLTEFDEQLGIEDRPKADADPGILTSAVITADSPLSFLRTLVVYTGPQETAHLVLLSNVTNWDAVNGAISGIAGVQLIDPTGDVTHLLHDYRQRAMILLGISAALMVPILLWRYGLRASLRVLLPPALSVVLTPLLAALVGVPFTFFNAMALILVLSIAFDYAVFCRETQPAQRPVTMLGVWLAMATTILSFGLLAFSHVFAVHAFGITLLIGTSLAFLFSPLAGDARTH